MKINNKFFSQAVSTAITNKALRNITAKKIDKYLHEAFLKSGSNALPGMLEKRYQYTFSLLHCLKDNLDKGYVSPTVIRKTLKVFIGDNFKTDRIQKNTDTREIYLKKYGQYSHALFHSGPF